jgi:ribosomal protein L29
MKKTVIEELRNKTIKELDKEGSEIIKQIAKLQLESKVNPPKNTNLIINKRKRLAVILTIKSDKKTVEKQPKS